MTARREALARTAAALVLGATLACKLKEPAQTPVRLVDDIAQIEAALAQREDELGRAGIVVAQRAPAADDAAPIESPAEPDVDATAPELANDDEEAPAQLEPPATTAEAPIDASATQDSASTERRARRAGRTARNRTKRSRVALDDARAPTRCETICGLAQTTCELRDRVCTMAEDHPDDVRYEAACRRAGDQCSAATEHCDSCAV